MKRVRSCAHVAVVAAACLGHGACRQQLPDGTPAPIETQLSILHLNLRGVADVPDGDPAGLWTTRYDRIGAELGAMGVVPDVIALQEVTTHVWCPENYNFLFDYDAVRALLVSLQQGVGVRYRVAYVQLFARDRRMGSGPPGIGYSPTINGGRVGECRASTGLGLLYNPDRIKNRMTDLDATAVAGAFAFDQDTRTPALRQSLPCCVGSVWPGHESVCGLIDGPVRSNTCGTARLPAPAGLATQVSADVAVARLELALRRNTTFHVYNLHLPWRGNPGYSLSAAALRAIVDSVEQETGRWIPPLIVGDFNNDQEFVREALGDFDFLGAADLDGIIFTLGGNAAHYGSNATIARHETIRLPRASTEDRCVDPGVLWSDHCAVLTRLYIREH